jgi:ubiquinone/menaquinone biosynthesis C-methylase UbiE
MVSLRRLRRSIKDRFDLVVGNRDLFTPPRWMVIQVGGGDFKAIGEGFLRQFIEAGGLKPSDRVLDVGSGCGRIALPLTRYLSPEGRYCGFDVMGEPVKWCQKTIGSRFANFSFVQADIFNKAYNPKGRSKAAEYRFPYDDNAFDFVLLTSVFTHLVPADLERYLTEIARVLRPGGKFFSTFFLLNDVSQQCISRGVSKINFQHVLGPWSRSERSDTPEWAVAHDEGYVEGLCERLGFEIARPIQYGYWSGRPLGNGHQTVEEAKADYQDYVWALKKP